MKTGPIAPLPPSGGSRRAESFRLNWREDIYYWRLMHRYDLPMTVVRSALEQIVNRDGGRAFLLPSLAKASGLKLTPERIGRDLSIAFIQEGADSGIFKLEAKVAIPGQGAKTVAICLNVARNSGANELHAQIFRNLGELRRVNPAYVVEPLCCDLATVKMYEDKYEVAIFSTEWLESTEVNMFNLAEPVADSAALDGLEMVGMRGVCFNMPSFPGTFEDLVKDQALADKIATEMVKVLATYFDPETMRMIGTYGINGGDFVCQLAADGSFSLKLITCRDLPRYPDLLGSPEPVRAFPFLEELFNHRENSVNHQDPGWLDDFLKYAIYVFIPKEICVGLTQALMAKYGEGEGGRKAFEWLGTYFLLDKRLPQWNIADREERAHFFRQLTVRHELQLYLEELSAKV